MSIRAAAKALIVKDGQVLLQCCVDDVYHLDYYELPGGGQRQGETMEDAIRRECLEETGYHVNILRFFAIGEELIEIESVKRDFPDHAHRIFHIFLCEVAEDAREVPSEEDRHQVDIRWFPLEEVPNLRLRPTNLRNVLLPLLSSNEIGYFGTNILDDFAR